MTDSADHSLAPSAAAHILLSLEWKNWNFSPEAPSNSEFYLRSSSKRGKNAYMSRVRPNQIRNYIFPLNATAYTAHGFKM